MMSEMTMLRQQFSAMRGIANNFLKYLQLHSFH